MFSLMNIFKKMHEVNVPLLLYYLWVKTLVWYSVNFLKKYSAFSVSRKSHVQKSILHMLLFSSCPKTRIPESLELLLAFHGASWVAYDREMISTDEGKIGLSLKNPFLTYLKPIFNPDQNSIVIRSLSIYWSLNMD